MRPTHWLTRRTYGLSRALILCLFTLTAYGLGCGDARLVDTGEESAEQEQVPAEEAAEQEENNDGSSGLQEAAEWYEEQGVVLHPWVYGFLPEMLEGLEVTEVPDEGEYTLREYSFPRGTMFDPFFEQIKADDVLWSPLGNNTFDSVFSVFVLETAHIEDRWIFLGRDASFKEVYFKLSFDTREDGPNAAAEAFEEAIRQSAGHDLIDTTQMQGLTQTRKQAVEVVDIDENACGSIELNNSNFRVDAGGIRLDKIEFGLCLAANEAELTRSHFCTSKGPGEIQWFKVSIKPRLSATMCFDTSINFRVDPRIWRSSVAGQKCACIYQNWGNERSPDVTEIATGGTKNYGSSDYDGCLPSYNDPWDIFWNNTFSDYDNPEYEREMKWFELNFILQDYSPSNYELSRYRYFYNELHRGVFSGDSITRQMFNNKKSERRRELIRELRDHIEYSADTCEATMDYFRFLYDVDATMGMDLEVEIDMLELTETPGEVATSSNRGGVTQKDEFGDPDNKLTLFTSKVPVTPIPGVVLLEPKLYWTYDLFKTAVGAKMIWSKAENNEIAARMSYEGGWLYEEFQWKDVDRDKDQGDFSGDLKAPVVEIKGSTESSVGLGLETPIKLVGVLGPYLDMIAGAKASASVSASSRGGGSVSCQLGMEVGFQTKAGFKGDFSLAGRKIFDLFDYAATILNTCGRHSWLPKAVDDFLNDYLCFKWDRNCSNLLNQATGNRKEVNTVEISFKKKTEATVPTFMPEGAAIDQVFVKRGERVINFSTAKIGSRVVTDKVRNGDYKSCDYSVWESTSVFLVKEGNRDDKLVLEFNEPLQPGDVIHVNRHSSGNLLGTDEDTENNWGCPIRHEIEVKVGEAGNGPFRSVKSGQDNINDATIGEHHFF